MSRDMRLLLTVSAARMFGYGVIDVIFALYLIEMGFTSVQVGFLLTATLIGSAMLNLVLASIADRLGRRSFLALMTFIMAASVGILIAGVSFPIQLVAALTGTLNFTAPSTTGFAAVEQAILPQISPKGETNRVFGQFNLVSLLTRMSGALVAGLPELTSRGLGINLVYGYQLLLGFFLLISLLSLICIALLSPAVEISQKVKAKAPSRSILALDQSKMAVVRLATLSSFDALSSGFVAQSLVVLWFNQRFGAGPEILGLVFSAARLIQAGSYPVAIWLADRFGLLNSIVFTHFPSQLLLFAVAFSPSLPVAIALWLVRNSLCHMDVPLRQAYLVSLVHPEERTSAGGIIHLTRNLTQSISPSITGVALQSLAYGLPFVLSALSGAVYDIGLFFSFRHVKFAHEEPAVQTSS